MPMIRDACGCRMAFLFPAALMAAAFVLFAAGKPFYAVETICRARPAPADRRQRRLVLSRLLGLFAVVVFFFSAYDQSAGTWTLFARDHLDLNVFGWKAAPDQVQSLNAILIVVLLPPLTIFWHVLARLGLELRPTDKMLVGFVLMIVTTAILSAAGFLAAGASDLTTTRSESQGRPRSLVWTAISRSITTRNTQQRLRHEKTS